MCVFDSSSYAVSGPFSAADGIRLGVLQGDNQRFITVCEVQFHEYKQFHLLIRNFCCVSEESPEEETIGVSTNLHVLLVESTS